MNMDGFLDMIQGAATVIVLLQIALIAAAIIVGVAVYIDGQLPLGERIKWL